MKTLTTYVLCLLIVLLPGCSLMTPQQKSATQLTIENEFEQGRLTAAQRDAALEALDSKGTFDWETMLAAGGSVLASILLGVPIAVGRVQAKRGAPRTPAQTVALQTLAEKQPA